MIIERLIKGFVRPLYKVVALQMMMFPSYPTVVDCVRMLKMKEMEICASQEWTKKTKTKSNFSG